MSKVNLRKNRVKHKVNDPITENRRVICINGSYYLNLPREFVDAHNIKPGQKVPITADHLLKVIPHSER